MPRDPRIHVPDGFHHVILRGNNRQNIFFNDADRRYWMQLLADGIDRYRHRLHAYCWMTNHVHMVVQVSDLPLGDMVRWVASQYARSTNKRQNKTGHLFERRYRSNFVDTDAYLLQLVRYIHRNPVVAHLVDDPAHYLWSSHRAYLKPSRSDFLITDKVLSCFGATRRKAISAYSTFMAEECPDSIEPPRPARPSEEFIGDEELRASNNRASPSAEETPSLTQLIEELCQRYGVSAHELASSSRARKNSTVRAAIALAARQRGIAGLNEVANRFNRSASALGHAVRNLSESGKQHGP